MGSKWVCKFESRNVVAAWERFLNCFVLAWKCVAWSMSDVELCFVFCEVLPGMCFSPGVARKFLTRKVL